MIYKCLKIGKYGKTLQTNRKLSLEQIKYYLQNNKHNQTRNLKEACRE